MVKGRTTITLSARVPDSVYAVIVVDAEKRGMTVSEYVGWVLRAHITAKVPQGVFSVVFTDAKRRGMPASEYLDWIRRVEL